MDADKDPKADAVIVVAKLNAPHIAYAANAKRGEYRGFAALHDLMDANRLLPAGDMDTPEKFQAHVAYCNLVIAEVNKILLAHPLANLPQNV